MLSTRHLALHYRYFSTAVSSLAMPNWFNVLPIRLVIGLLLASLAFAYVVKTSSMAESGYELHKLENQLTTLQTDIEKTSIKIAEVSAITKVEERLKEVKMVSAPKPKYLMPSGSVVAVK